MSTRTPREHSDMISLQQVYPSLRESVLQKRECAELRDASNGDLLDLIHQLVVRLDASSPINDENVHDAKVAYSCYQDAASSSREVRADLITEIVESIRPAVNAFLGGVPRIMDFRGRGKSPIRTEHDMLSGMKLHEGKKRVSYWLVSLKLDDPLEAVHVRFARLTPRGALSDEGVGKIVYQIELVTVADVAQGIRHYDFEKVISNIVSRIESMSKSDRGMRLFEAEKTLLDCIERLRSQPS